MVHLTFLCIQKKPSTSLSPRKDYKKFSHWSLDGLLQPKKKLGGQKNFSQKTPSLRVEFSVDDLNFSIVCHGNETRYDDPASVFFIIEEKHFIKPYKLKRLLAIIRLINRDELESFSTSYNDSDEVCI